MTSVALRRRDGRTGAARPSDRLRIPRNSPRSFLSNRAGPQSGYRAVRLIADDVFRAEIVDIRTSSGGTYGSPWLHAMLARRSIAVGRIRVDRVMRGAGLQGALLPETLRLGFTHTDPRAAKPMRPAIRSYEACNCPCRLRDVSCFAELRQAGRVLPGPGRAPGRRRR